MLVIPIDVEYTSEYETLSQPMMGYLYRFRPTSPAHIVSTPTVLKKCSSKILIHSSEMETIDFLIRCTGQPDVSQSGWGRPMQFIQKTELQLSNEYVPQQDDAIW